MENARGAFILTHEDYAKKFNAKWNEEYELVGEYRGSGKPIKMKHLKCGRVIEKPAGEALRYGCRECALKKNLENLKPKEKQSEKEFIKKFNNKFKGRYSLVSKYDGMKTSAKFKCNNCGREFNTRPDDLFFNNRTCNCEYHKWIAERRIKKKERKQNYLDSLWTPFKFKEKIKDIWSDEYTILGEFMNISTKVRVRHNICGNTYAAWPQSLLRGHGCIKCSRASNSAGARRIESHLKEYGISYKREVGLKGCVRERQLLFDFVLYDKSKQVIAVIEYDGEQHYRMSRWFGGERKLQLLKERDEIKNNYCKANGIYLIRVPFFVKDIASHLAHKIKELQARI